MKPKTNAPSGKKMTLALFKKATQRGSEVVHPTTGQKEIMLEWGRIGAWITSGGIGGKKTFVMSEQLYRANVK